MFEHGRLGGISYPRAGLYNTNLRNV